MVESPSESNSSDQLDSSPEEDLLCSHLNAPTTSEFLSNILFYIGGYIVSKLVKKLSCSSCKTSLLAQFTTTTPDHDYCALNYSEDAPASAFTLFVNNGGLQIPSDSVYAIVEYAEKVFKANVCNNDHKITRQERLKEKLVMKVCNHFILDASHQVFNNHEQGLNENVFEEDHRSKLIKLTAERYFTLRLFTYGKRYNDAVVTNGRQSERHQLTKLILFRNE